MSTAQTVGESKVWVNKVLYMAPDPVADELSRLSCEVSNLKLANKEARKTIDRLNALIPREANHGGPVSEGRASADTRQRQMAALESLHDADCATKWKPYGGHCNCGAKKRV